MAYIPTIPVFRSECPPKIWMQGGLRQIFLELTALCNNRCPGCINESFIDDFSLRTLKLGDHHQPLSKDDWLHILLKLPETVKTVILSGGEPTLHSEIYSFIEELENRDYHFIIFTNGRWPNPERLIGLLQKARNFDGFLISLHGSTATTHDAFTGKAGSFDETIHNIRNATNSKLPVTLSTVITSRNLDELARMPLITMQLGAEGLSFNRYLYTPERMLTLGDVAPPSPDQLQSAVIEIEALQKAFSNNLSIGYGPTIPQCFEESSSDGCSAGDASLVIDPWGNVKPCLHANLLCGNLKTQDFETIWRGKELTTWRALSGESCTSCSAFASCGGGCRAMTLSWGNSQDPLMVSGQNRNFVRLSALVK